MFCGVLCSNDARFQFATKLFLAGVAQISGRDLASEPQRDLAFLLLIIVCVLSSNVKESQRDVKTKDDMSSSKNNNQKSV
jgi:hypothetical protein